MTREGDLTAFLDAAGWDQAERAPLAGDASFRCYERLRLGDSKAVLMDAPPGREDARAFVRIARHLTGLGLSAPKIYDADAERGFVLLEDLGDDTLAGLLARGEAPEPLYRLAVDVLINLHRRTEAEVVPADLPIYDSDTIVREAELFTGWYLPAVTGKPTSAEAQSDFSKAWRDVLGALSEAPRTLMLRDYFPDNLMRLDGRSGVAACGILDFQDAVAGPPAYDLVSLIEDARRDVPPDLSQAMMTRYRAAFPEIDGREFDAAYRILGAQRHVRVLGVFVRLCRRDGKPDYLAHIPRLWRLLENALRHPALGPVADWFAAHVPPDRRIVPAAQESAE